MISYKDFVADYSLDEANVAKEKYIATKKEQRQKEAELTLISKLNNRHHNDRSAYSRALKKVMASQHRVSKLKTPTKLKKPKK